MSELNIATRSWKDFQDDPLPGIHTDYLLDSLDPLRIQDEDMFWTATSGQHQRALFVGLLRQQYALPSLVTMQPQRHDAILAALSTEQWHDTAHACGLMYWSRMLAREVHAPVLRNLEQAFGTSWWRWVELGLSEPIGADIAAHVNAKPDDPLAWPSWIQHAGQALLRSWRDDLDTDLAAWVKLKDIATDAGSQAVWQLDAAYGGRLLRRLSAVVGQESEAV